jgi:hypothetical protein
MKTKKFDKKLVLSKETVADLNGNEMKVVYGGNRTEWPFSRCVTDCLACTPTAQSQCCP